MTATLFGHEYIPELLLSSPGALLLSKFLRSIVVCNFGLEVSKTKWYEAYCQTIQIGMLLGQILSLTLQHWKIPLQQLEGDMNEVWSWLDGSFSGKDHELAVHVANAFCLTPLHDGTNEVSLMGVCRQLDERPYGFDNLQRRATGRSLKESFPWQS